MFKKGKNFMDKKAIPVGIENFERIIKDGYYYVDKSLLIEEMLENRIPVTLFTRPRRFGKTLKKARGIKNILKLGIAFYGKSVKVVSK